MFEFLDDKAKELDGMFNPQNIDMPYAESIKNDYTKL